MSFYKWMIRRECGFKPQFGDLDFLSNKIYRSMEPYKHWSGVNAKNNVEAEHGSVFNLEFSPQGNILVAACEKKSVLIFDSVSTKKVNQVLDAHTDSVNCIRFLDNRMFATCSDDTTVALWDLRNLKAKLRSLNGHANWVKSIEYSPKDNLLLTSAFDGSIFTWDVNSYTEQGLIYQNVFHTSGLMRCRLSPDCTKLVICSTGGYLMIIHDLDLTTLQKDLSGFRPSIYRLMQMGQQYIPQAAKYDHVFSKRQKKNRVELVTDFPVENDAEIVMSLLIHPHGHSFLSRNISHGGNSEWSCVHSILDEPGDITDQLKMPLIKRKRNYVSEDENEQDQRPTLATTANAEAAVIDEAPSRARARRVRLSTRTAEEPTVNHVPPINFQADAFVPDIWAAEVTLQERAMRQNRERGSNSVNGYNFVYAISSGVLPTRLNSNSAIAYMPRVVLNTLPRRSDTRNDTPRTSNEPEPNAATTENNNSNSRSSSSSSSSSNSSSSSTDTSPSSSPQPIILTRNHQLRLIHLKRKDPNLHRQIFQNAKKLMFYKEESTHGKGIIKEPSYSSDGRIIASPYENGIRLLAYTAKCSQYPTYEVDDISQRLPKELVLIKNIQVNNKVDTVLTARFSPCEHLLVSGCQSGKIVWYHPNL